MTPRKNSRRPHLAPRKPARALLFLCALLASAAPAEEADIAGRKNRLSFDYGPFIGYLASGNFPLVVNYELLMARNLAMHFSGGILAAQKEPSNEYWSVQAGFRKYWLGRHQRLSLGMLPFAQYWKTTGERLTFGIPIVVGYTWQWTHLFTAVETGFGPGGSEEAGEDGGYQTLASGSLRFGFLF